MVRVLVDMNLSPEWVGCITGAGFEAVHWSTIGAGNAPDAVLMRWARDNEHVVFTHDLDFGILLAHSKEGRPSVIQTRARDLSVNHLGLLLVGALPAHADALERWALVTVDEVRSGIRILPILPV